MIKKLNSLLFFTLLSITVFAQTKKQYADAKVSYAVKVHLDKNQEIYKFYEKHFPGLVASAEAVDSDVNFSLVFNDSISIFYLENIFFSDNRITNFILRNSRYYGRIKQQTKNYITEELEEDFGRFLVSRPYQQWELHDESKMIGDFLCLKATTFYTVTTPKGKVFKHDFTAWYTSELPYKFGPAGYGNLPGLIMELKGTNFTYSVKNIEFYDGLEKMKNEIPTLKRLKLITEEEFEELAAEDEKRRRKQD